MPDRMACLFCIYIMLKVLGTLNKGIDDMYKGQLLLGDM